MYFGRDRSFDSCEYYQNVICLAKKYLNKLTGADENNKLNLNNSVIDVAKSSMTAGHHTNIDIDNKSDREKKIKSYLEQRRRIRGRVYDLCV